MDDAFCRSVLALSLGDVARPTDFVVCKPIDPTFTLFRLAIQLLFKAAVATGVLNGLFSHFTNPIQVLFIVLLYLATRLIWISQHIPLIRVGRAAFGDHLGKRTTADPLDPLGRDVAVVFHSLGGVEVG